MVSGETVGPEATRDGSELRNLEIDLFFLRRWNPDRSAETAVATEPGGVRAILGQVRLLGRTGLGQFAFSLQPFFSFMGCN